MGCAAQGDRRRFIYLLHRPHCRQALRLFILFQQNHHSPRLDVAWMIVFFEKLKQYIKVKSNSFPFIYCFLPTLLLSLEVTFVNSLVSILPVLL